jgi:hypothetical protein
MASFSGMRFDVVRANLLWFPLAVAGGLKGGVLVFAGAGLVLAIKKSSLLPVVLLALAPCLLASLWVYDLTRSLAFSFPSFFLAIVVLRLQLQTRELRRLMLVGALGCALLPTYWVLLRVHCLLPAARWL